jgi:hypothetical protein
MGHDGRRLPPTESVEYLQGDRKPSEYRGSFGYGLRPERANDFPRGATNRAHHPLRFEADIPSHLTWPVCVQPSERRR